MSWNKTCEEWTALSRRVTTAKISLPPDESLLAPPQMFTLPEYCVDNASRWNTTADFEQDFSISRPKVLVGVITVVLSFITLVTVVANLMILLAFLTAPKLRKPTNYFYVSMAVSDFAAGLLVLPLGVYDWYQNEYWRLGKVACVFWVTMDYFLYTATAYIMCAICLDRYLAIFHSFRYRRKRSGRLVLKFIIVAWVVGFLGEVPATTLWETFAGNSTIDYEEYCDVEFADHSVYTSVKMFFSPIFPCAVIFVLYLRIYITIRRRSVRRKASLDKLLMTSDTRVFTSSQRVVVYEKLSSKRTEWVKLTRKSSVMADFKRSVCRESVQDLQAGRLGEDRDGDTLARESAKAWRKPMDVRETVLRSENNDAVGRDRVARKVSTTQTDNLDANGDSPVSLKRGEDKFAPAAAEASEILLDDSSDKRESEQSTSKLDSVGLQTSLRKESIYQDSPAHSYARGYRSKHIVRQSSSDRRAAVLLTILVGFFLLSYVPWVVISIYEAIRPDQSLPFTIYTVAVWLQYVNSLINPFLYVYQDLEFRHAVAAVLRRPKILLCMS